MANTPTELLEGNCYVALTYDLLDSKVIMDKVRSPKAGAIVLFAGTTRDNFNNKPVKELQYQSYTPLALRTMLQISQSIATKHSLTAVAMVHRLGVVPIGEESILIAVSSPHRQAAWRAGEEMLEEVKEKVEIWKREEFGGEDGGIWRANRDGAAGEKVEETRNKENEKPKENRQEDAQADDQTPHPIWGLGARPKPPVERGHGPVVHPDRPRYHADT